MNKNSEKNTKRSLKQTLNDNLNRYSRKLTGAFHQVVDRITGSGLMQSENEAFGEKEVTPGIAELIRQAGAEGCVLLKNDGVLPLHPKEEVTVFGRCQLDWFYVGYGSGGDVHAPYTVNLMEGLCNAKIPVNEEMAQTYRQWTQEPDNKAFHGWWGHWPFHHSEMPLDINQVQRAAASSSKALVVIGRAAGEDRENKLEPGSYFLTEEEKKMLDTVTSAFEQTIVVLNIGSVMDLSWTEDYGDSLSAILIAWMGGMESGNAAADVLCGKVNPCGKLSDSIARHYEDYPSSSHFGGRVFNRYVEGIFLGYRYFDRHPEKVLWPFGFGLSYTEFSIKALHFEDGRVTVEVKNIGEYAGKEVLQLYCAQPKGKVKKARRVLAAFVKTKLLLPGESQIVTLSYDERSIASYDSSLHAFVLEAGTYRFLVNGKKAGSMVLSESKIVEQCHKIGLKGESLRQRILEHLPKELQKEHARESGSGSGDSLWDVLQGKITLDTFVAQLKTDELEALTRGHGTMNSELGTEGNAGVFGGILSSLRQKGVRPITCCDGPAGLRLKRFTSLQPCGTALACTWNTELVEALSEKIGEEMKRFHVDVILSPGMNLHRNPLCGRNFEYFSEDPLLSGKMASATVRGIQKNGKAACPKHFACNNQEWKRNTHDSRVSEQALRELYLRNFEICVREGKPKTLMTSYNKVNGVWSHYHYDLVTTVLRREWGFDGMVMTDWWMRRAVSPEFHQLRDNAYRVRAQVDVLMPGNMDMTAKDYKKDGSLKGITRAELQRGARNVLKLILSLPAHSSTNPS